MFGPVATQRHGSSHKGREVSGLLVLFGNYIIPFFQKGTNHILFFRAHRDFVEKGNICFPKQNDFLAVPGNNFLQEKYVLLSPATTGNYCSPSQHLLLLFFR